jgi:hypothetical protein
LIVGKLSGVVEPQSFINGIFWQIDSRNVGEVKEAFCQLYYDDVESVTVTEDDIQKIVEINTGIGATISTFRTAPVLKKPEVIRFAKLHHSLAQKHGFEVALFTTLEDGFAWLDCENPEPEIIEHNLH